MNIIYEKNKFANIKLDKNKRYIKSFIEKKLDITIIEILDEDNIKSFFEVDEKFIQNKDLKGENIFSFFSKRNKNLKYFLERYLNLQAIF